MVQNVVNNILEHRGTSSPIGPDTPSCWLWQPPRAVPQSFAHDSAIAPFPFASEFRDNHSTGGSATMTLSSGIELPSDRISEICKRYEVRELAVFGSAARGDLGPESDVDMLVDFEPDARIGLVKFASLSEELEALVGRKVDLVTKTGLKPRVRSEVLGEAQLVYSA